MLILAVGLFYLSTIRPGHNWGDDFSMYIHHARNIVEGKPYADTGYVHNPQKIVGPLTYPPVFPLLLAPVYEIWGMNLTAMKVMIILVFMLALVAVHRALKNELSSPYLAAVIALTGLNPQFWQLKDNIVSDLPFILFTYLSIHIIHESARPGRSLAAQCIFMSLVGVSIYLAYGTRTIGLVLVPCLVVYYLVKMNKVGLFAVFTVLLTSALILLQTNFLNIAGAYAGHVGLNLWNAAFANALVLSQLLNEFLLNGHSKILRLALFAILSTLALIGFLGSIMKKRLTCFEIFLPFYLAPFVILPLVLVNRFLMPIIPLYLFYSFLGIQAIASFAGAHRQRAEKILFSGVLVAALASYAGEYSRLDYGPIQDGVTSSEAQQLFDYVRREVGGNEVVVFRKPRALSLFTGRPSAAWHNTTTDAELWDFIRRIDASYLIAGPEYVEPDDQWFIRAFIDRNRDRLLEVFANADFKVYRINKAALEI
jgi:hypothetical protein